MSFTYNVGLGKGRIFIWDKMTISLLKFAQCPQFFYFGIWPLFLLKNSLDLFLFLFFHLLFFLLDFLFNFFLAFLCLFFYFCIFDLFTLLPNLVLWHCIDNSQCTQGGESKKQRIYALKRIYAKMWLCIEHVICSKQQFYEQNVILQA